MKYDYVRVNLDEIDINRYRFRTAKLEASCPLAVTTNSRVVANGEDASRLAGD
jgi:hypothetical protein